MAAQDILIGLLFGIPLAIFVYPLWKYLDAAVIWIWRLFFPKKGGKK